MAKLKPSTAHSTPDQRRRRGMIIVTVYPLVVLLVSVLVNVLAFGINPIVVVLPSTEIVASLAIAAALLVVNHTCLMTSTELVRVRFGMRASPEEWEKINTTPVEPCEQGLRELERRHNAHRNSTENIVYFALLAPVFACISPPTLGAHIWILGFAFARLGHSYSYLTRNVDLRGLFMTLSLIAMYGMASYLVMSTF